MTTAREILCVAGGLVTATIMEKKGINPVSPKGIIVAFGAAIVFVTVIEIIFKQKLESRMCHSSGLYSNKEEREVGKNENREETKMEKSFIV